jgi:DNA-binding NarL/FixJ family response regulator
MESRESRGTDGGAIRVGEAMYRYLAFDAGSEPSPAGLTASEREVVGHVVRGWSSRKIAELRGVSERTVNNQLAAVYRKLGVCNRFDLVRVVIAGE